MGEKGVREMLKIAICDDEPQAAAQEEAIVRDSLRACGVAGEVTRYTQSQTLLDDLTDDGFFYDLLLLDIEMPGLDGMEMARRCRAILPKVRIIFVTSHREYAIDAFELSIFRYVPKSDRETRLAAAVTDAAKLIQLEAGQTYTIQTASRLERISFQEILYIQREGKNARIVSASGTAKVRKSLQQVFEELHAPEFVFLDRGCIANILQIRKISGGMAELSTGQRLPISRGHLQDVKEKINRFWGERIG